MKMKNNEKIMDMLKNYSVYKLRGFFEKTLLENTSNVLELKFTLTDLGNRQKGWFSADFDVCITEKSEYIEETTNYTARGINVSVKCRYFKYENFDEWELYGSISEVILINEKKEKLRIFIDYKKNICGYTSNIKSLELKQYYKPNNGSSLESYLSEKYIRVTSFIFAPRDFEDLEKELKNVEKHFHNDLTGEIIVNDWEEYEPSPDDNMDFLKNISSGRNCLYLDEK